MASMLHTYQLMLSTLPIDYIVSKQGVSATQVGDAVPFGYEFLLDNLLQYVQSIQAGTEPFTGSAKLDTTNYSVELRT